MPEARELLSEAKDLEFPLKYPFITDVFFALFEAGQGGEGEGEGEEGELGEMEIPDGAFDFEGEDDMPEGTGGEEGSCGAEPEGEGQCTGPPPDWKPEEADATSQDD